LSACGVKEEPSPLELAQLLVKSPQESLDNLGFDSYLAILRQIASHYPVLKANRALLSDMKTKAFLVGFTNNSSQTDSETGKEVNHFRLARAQDIYLIDDAVLGQLFHPLGYFLV
jgi:hypothetical protein